MRDWAAEMIGTPWAPDHDCWWLARAALRILHGVEILPMRGALRDEDRIEGLRVSAAALGFVRQDQLPPPGGLVFMRDRLSARHAAVAVELGGQPLLLHSEGRMTPAGPSGAVAAEPLSALLARGFHELEFWGPPHNPTIGG